MTPRTRPATKRKLCPECRVSGVWRYDDNGNSLGKCETCFPIDYIGTPEEERDAALAAVGDAHPSALKAALLIIEDAAKAEPFITANSLRPLMNYAGIPGPVRGRAWREAAANGWITKDGAEPSLDAPTHGHEIKRWKSHLHGSRGAEGRTA